MLQINEEEKAYDKRQRLANDTFRAIKHRDPHIIDVLRKRRGRKKFILID